MPARLTDALNVSSGIAKALSLCPDDSRVIDYINQAQQELLAQGRWWGTMKRIQLCVTDGCITLPREVGNIEAIAVCGKPIPLRNSWYEFTANLARVQSCDNCQRGSCGAHLQALPHQDSVTFADIKGNDKTIRTYIGTTEDAGKHVIYQGYDQNWIWIRTQPGGAGTEWIDGEQVTLGMPFVDTSSKFSVLSAVIKDETNLLVRVYEHNTTTDTDRSIAIYQPDETEPTYARLLIPHISSVQCGCSASCTTKTVTAIASLRFIPAKNANDWLLIGNLPALREMCTALIRRESNQDGEAEASFGRALRILRAELRKNGGDITNTYIDIHGPAKLNRVMGGFW